MGHVSWCVAQCIAVGGKEERRSSCEGERERLQTVEAAYYGHLNLVEYFIEKGAPINVLDKFGQTPLFRAVDGGRHEVVKYLVEKKAETNWLDNDQCSVQHCAAFQGFPQLSSWLVYKGAWRPAGF
ncbi:Psmd10 [Symbiodinium pilosum]|uniref:Psmd10 protein n=1 Tax=Symbiodinium pilosum TaxID=2952 RepID=A0A812W106_SYMPI|nr:Psmd10 [Symbiodinium pilosum]